MNTTHQHQTKNLTLPIHQMHLVFDPLQSSLLLKKHEQILDELANRLTDLDGKVLIDHVTTDGLTVRSAPKH